MVSEKQTAMMLADGYVGATAVAEAIGVHPSSVHRQIKQGVYAGVQASNGRWFIKPIDVLRTLKGYPETSTIRRNVEALVAQVVAARATKKRSR